MLSTATSQELQSLLSSSDINKVTNYDSYIWSVPSMSRYEKTVLCVGYVKRNYDNYITIPIIELFANYYTNDEFGLYDIINAEHKQKFVSPIFSIKNFKWYLECYSNGSNSATKGEVILYICLAMLPTQLSKITAEFKLTLKQTDTTYRDIAVFSSDDSYGGWPRHTLSLPHLIDATSNKLEFELDIYILNVYDETQNIIPDYVDKCITPRTPIKYLPTMTYDWIINDEKLLTEMKNAKLCQQFNGPLAKIKSLGLYLRVYPNGASTRNEGKINIGLKVLFWPSNLSKMLVQCKLTLNELNLWKSGPKCFDSTHLSLSWNTTEMMDVLQDLNEISFMTNLKIVDILDKNGISIINNYIDRYEFKYFDESTVSKFEWKISDEVTLNEINAAKMGDTFNSDLFQLGPFSMYLQFRPTVTDSSKVWLGLKLSHLPTKIAELICKCKLIFREGDTFKTGYKCFQENHLGFAMNTRITKEILKDFEQLTFSVEISILDVVEQKQFEIEKKDYMISDGIGINKLDKLPMVHHTWFISDGDKVEQLKQASNVHCCVSPIFTAFGFKWYIGFWPNGSRESRAGHINIYLNCTSFMSLTLSVVVRYTLTLQNIQINTFYHAFTSDANCWGRVKWMPLTTNIHCLDEFHFAANIELIDVYDNGEVITDRFVDNSLLQTQSIAVPSQITEWKISKAIFNDSIYINGEAIYGPHFEMHGMVWYLSLYANGKNKNNEGSVEICINNMELPTNESIVCLRYIIVVKETDTRYCAATTFCKSKLVETWGHERISTNTFKELKTITIELRMDLIDVYDNGMNITESIAPIDDYKDGALYQTQTNIKTLQKLTDKLKLMNGSNEIGEMESFSVCWCNIESENALLLWLKYHVGLEQYYTNFVDYGVTDVSIIKCMTDNDLQAMGIRMVQHRVRILIEISNLMVTNTHCHHSEHIRMK